MSHGAPVKHLCCSPVARQRGATCRATATMNHGPCQRAKAEQTLHRNVCPKALVNRSRRGRRLAELWEGAEGVASDNVGVKWWQSAHKHESDIQTARTERAN
jgi:hypothetical protein